MVQVDREARVRGGVMWHLLAGTALATTWTVAPSGGDYDAIQDAIDGASDGDVVEVAAGTWNESLDLRGRDLTLRSASGAASTVLAPPSGATAIVWDGGEDGALEGFTVRPTGARAFVIDGGSPSITDCVVEGAGSMGAIDGGAVVIDGGTPTLTRVQFEDCAGRRGGVHFMFVGRFHAAMGLLSQNRFHSLLSQVILRARTAEEPGRVQIIPDCLSRLPTTCLQAPSTAPEPMS